MASTSPVAERAPPPEMVLRRMMTGYWIAQAIHVAAQLGLADLLVNGPRTATDMAKATSTQPRALHRLLRALASVGIFVEHEPGRFGLTELAECLRSDRPGSQRSLAVMMGEEHFRAWGDLLYSVRTGRTAFEHIYGQPIFAYLAQQPRAARIFDEAMVGVHGVETGAMLDAYDFSGIGTLVDVGGGNGSLLIATLRRHPNLLGLLYDRPDVIERARANLEAAGLTQRCKTVAGSFFDSIPSGGDAYLMRHILHDWDDAQALTILNHCRQVMPAHGRLLVVEGVVPPGNGPSFTKLLDLNMLVLPGGLERTEEEYRALLAAAHFRLQRIVPTASEVGVIEGVPV